MTGAAGYVAGRLIEHLERDEAIDRILAIDIRPLRSQYSSKVSFHQRDVTTPIKELLSEHSIDALVHLGFILSPAHNRASTQRVNVGGAATVLDGCARAGVRHFLYLSSTTVYGAHADNPRLLTEESPVRLVNGFRYGEDKATVEALITDATQRHPTMTATVLRSCPVMGPNADNFIARAFTKPFLVGVRGADPPMQLVHEDDLVEVMRLCLIERASGIYNVAAHGAIRWSEMVRMSGSKLVTLPASLLYPITGATWILRLQRDSPACGLDFIRYRWTVSTDKIQRALGVGFRHSAREAWQEFARRRKTPTSTEQAKAQ